MAEIVFVHGVGQEEKDPSRLLKDWVSALADGLEAAQGFRGVAARIRSEQVPVELAFYGDLFRKRGAQGSGPERPEDDELTGDALRWTESLGREWLERAAGRSSDQQAQREAATALAGLDFSNAEPMGIRSVLREMLAGLARIRWFAQPTLRRPTGGVASAASSHAIHVRHRRDAATGTGARRRPDGLVYPSPDRALSWIGSSIRVCASYRFLLPAAGHARVTARIEHRSI
jgi:hypothetical protein